MTARLSKLKGTISRNRAKELAIAYAGYREAVEPLLLGTLSKDMTYKQIRRLWCSLVELEKWQIICQIEMVPDIKTWQEALWTAMKQRDAALLGARRED